MKSENPVKILCVTSHSPEGEDYGARLRSRHIFRLLGQLAEVRLVVAETKGRYVPDSAAGPDILRPAEVMELRETGINGIRERLRHEFGPRELNFHGITAGGDDSQRLRSLADGHDLIWFHGLRVANAFGQWHWPRSVLDIDDIPSLFYQSAFDQAEGVVKKLRAFRQRYLWRRHESRIFERFDSVAVCSESDRAHFGSSNRVFVLPNGFVAPAVEPAPAPVAPLRLGFIGTLVYEPNQQALRWFLREVWPLILKQAPGVTLRLVGKKSDEAEWNAAANVQGLGFVADADAEMSTWALTVVPIFEGGGTRIKISTAFSRKCPVVSTTLGAHGYEVAHDRELLLADSPADFAAACLRILNDRAVGARLAETAWSAFLKNWTWEANLPRLENIIQATLKRVGEPAM
jgi:glycosyltransferase involved in cell wall biosynthesis